MKKLEIVFTALTLVAFALSLNGFPGGSFLSVILSAVLMLVCIGIGTKGMGNKQEGTSNQRALSLASYTAGSIFVILASLFRIMFWPMGNIMLYQAVVLTFIVFAVTAVAYARTKDKYYERLLIRNFLYLAWGATLIVLPGRALIAYKYGDSPFYEEYVKASDASNADLRNKELMQKRQEAWFKLRNTQRYLDSIAIEKERGK